MWRIHLLKILLLGILSNLNASLDSNCNGYTVDKCELGEDTVIETLKDSTEYDCQFFCNIVYSGVCKFFIFDKQQVVCQLINEELKTYTDTCRKFGGPPIPSIQECEALEDSCKVISPLITFSLFNNFLFYIFCVKFYSKITS